MDTNVRTPQDIFIQPRHLVVPPFQRPYVWEMEEQWAPFWHDVRRLAELQITRPSAGVTHFLGAIVVQTQDSFLGDLPASSVIDGQQRLTTLQLLMDATAACLEERGHDGLAGQLDDLTLNGRRYVPDGASQLKVVHGNRDGKAFDEVMRAEPPVQHAELVHASARVVRAHKYFSEVVAEWLGAAGDDSRERARVLTGALTRGLQIVAIDLAAAENSQEIFETLNARGTPLTAADLIRNFVFQRLDAAGTDVRQHLDDWPFETEFWEKDVSVGRFPMQRSSMFFNQWLTARVGEEVSPRATFTRFKQFVEQSELDGGATVAALLPIIREQAQAYETWTEAAADRERQLSRVELAVYRMSASGAETLKPILLWLHEPGRQTPGDVIDDVVSVVESWLVRRQMLRLSLGDMGRVVADLIRSNERVPPDRLKESVEAYLSRLDVASTYWPGDDEIREALRTEAVFRRLKKGRLRMLLESVENEFRRNTNQPQVSRRGYPIEHILPQKWETHWPVEGADASETRAEHVHRLGNLTLLTQALNAKVSNGAWPSKRAGLQSHDTLLLNSRLLKQADDRWDEAAIATRTSDLTDVLLSIWPVPDGHAGVVMDPEEKSAGWIQIKHLVDAGLLEPGTALTARSGAHTAVVRADGLLEIDGKTFDSPSGAGRHVRGSATNGWRFWSLADGRKLFDVRAAYTGQEPVKPPRGFDWSPLHALLEVLPEGRWTTYGALADAVGTAAQPLGAHVARCAQCTNAHRILSSDGTVASEFRWTDPEDERDPVEMLRSEGALVDGRPDPARRLNAVELEALVAQ